jgi:hypothetical protein
MVFYFSDTLHILLLRGSNSWLINDVVDCVAPKLIIMKLFLISVNAVCITEYFKNDLLVGYLTTLYQLERWHRQFSYSLSVFNMHNTFAPSSAYFNRLREKFKVC